MHGGTFKNFIKVPNNEEYRVLSFGVFLGVGECGMFLFFQIGRSQQICCLFEVHQHNCFSCNDCFNVLGRLWLLGMCCLP